MKTLKIQNKAQTLVDQVEDKLLNYLKDNSLTVGDAIPNETELSTALGVARSVLREALSRLKMIGMIESRTRRGMVLTEPSLFGGIKRIVDPRILSEESLYELLEFRVALEIGMSYKLFQNLTHEHLKELEEIVKLEIAFENNEYSLISEISFHSKLYEITVYKKNYQKAHVEKETISDKTEVTKPFTILLLGIDSEGQGIKEASSFNGDTIMLVSFDPVTLNATIFSIPRDTYVKMACGGRLNKINAASWGGTTCMVKTVQDLTGINVDYYAKINFKGVVDLVNVLGGVTVNVPISFCEQNSNREFGDALICLEPGVQKLDGEQALAFARHRHSLPLGDFQRAQHQQMIVEAMIQSMKSVRSVNDFYSILNAISNNIDTNMSTNEMLSFYNVAKNLLIKSGDVNLNITKTYLTGYDLYVYNGSGKAYTFQYYKQSLEDIVKAMNITLGKEKKEEIKDFTFDLNEPYEKKVIGKTYYNETRKQVVPDFTLMSVSEAKSWGNNNGITINVNETTSESEEYTDGQITSQSVHDGVLTEEAGSSITVTVIKKISQSEDINNNTSEEETE